MAPIDYANLRRAVRESRYYVTTHAKQRMGQREISDVEMMAVVSEGEMIEEYPDAKPFPKALFMKQTRGEPLYVSCAFDGEYAYVVTVHWYDPNVWVDPRTRRKA